MTANQILNNYLEALKMSDSSPIDLQKVVLDILKYLADDGKKEERQTIEQHKQMYINDNLWEKVMNISTDDGHNTFILLSDLRKILEEFSILQDEKDGR